METSYRIAAEPINGFGRPISGRYLAHARLTPAEWAYLAADLYSGRRFLVKPTMVQAAWLARKISTTYAHTALRRPDERWLVENGHLPLVMPRIAKSATPPLAPVEAYDIPDEFVGWDGVLELPEMRTW